MTTLYRAATASNPWFGRASFWTTKESFARRFARMLNGFAAAHPEIIAGPNVVYRAEVELDSSDGGNHLEFPAQLLLDSGDAIKVARKRQEQPWWGALVSGKHTWLSFYEQQAGEPGRMAVWEGETVPRNYVYLGDEPVTAELLDSLPAITCADDGEAA
jgi:hypothetical protein